MRAIEFCLLLPRYFIQVVKAIFAAAVVAERCAA